MGGGQNITVYSNTNTMATMYTQACTYTIPKHTFLPNLVVNNDAISTGGGGNPTVSPNKNMMTTFTNMITYTNVGTSIDMAYDSLYILINAADCQEP